MDFRSERMETREGKGVARRAWDSYAAVIGKTVTPRVMPFVQPGVDAAAREWVTDLIGFWVMWHLYGGFDNLVEYGFHPATVHRKVARFRKVFGAHPDEFQMPGLEIDAEKYWTSGTRKVGPPPTG